MRTRIFVGAIVFVVACASEAGSGKSDFADSGDSGGNAGAGGHLATSTGGSANAPSSGGNSSATGGFTGTGGNAGSDSGKGGTSGAGGQPGTTVQPCDALPAAGTWESITPAASTGTGSNALAVDPFDAGVVWLSASAQAPGGLYKSTDCGATWKFVSTGENANAVNAEGLNSLVLDPIHKGTMYASVGANGGPGTGVLKSTDGGVNWVNVLPPDSEVGKAIDYGLINSIGMEAANPSHLVVSMHASCHAPYGPVCEAESTDAGATWTLTTVAIPGVTGWVAGAGALILDANRWLFTTNDQGIWLTLDRGKTWSNVTPTGAVGATCGKSLNAPFSRRADGNYYLPSLHGILESSNATTWKLLPNSGGRSAGLASGMKHLFSTDLWEPGYHFAAFDHLETWTAIVPPSGLKPDQGAAFVAFDTAHGVLYSSSWSDGAWRIVMPADSR